VQLNTISRNFKEGTIAIPIQIPTQALIRKRYFRMPCIALCQIHFIATQDAQLGLGLSAKFQATAWWSRLAAALPLSDRHAGLK
jgi:hypothetical protein